MTFRRSSGVLPVNTVLAALAVLAPAIQAQVTADTPITILQTTDVHDHANGADHVGLDVNQTTGMGALGAYARISAYINYVRSSAGHPVVLVDSGDWTMGTLYDLTLSSSPLALSFLDRMQYNCVTLGNHEFDYSSAGLAQMLAAAQKSFSFRTPIVASNLNLGGSPDLTPFVGAGKAIQATRTEQLSNGLTIGYIGLMGKSAAQDAPVTAPVTFTDFSSNYAAIQTLVDGLRKAGANVVIALSHSGTDASGNSGEDVQLARNVTGIDVIASGHTHTPLASAHAVKNGSWTTQIIDAGAYGTNVARIDLTYHPATNSTTVDASTNQAMTDAGLAAAQATLAPDQAVAAMVNAADLQINAALAPFFGQTFSDFDKTKIGTGIYHAVATAAQNMASNAQDAVPAPNGLGDLSADAVRNVPNSIITQALASVGGDATKLPGYDVTPFQAGVVASGVLRSRLLSGVPLSFADIYNVTPLGASPDATQSIPVGYPLVSLYLDPADVKKVCALQLATQSLLTPGDDYLDISGLKYTLKPAESYVFFKYATAGEVLQQAAQDASNGSLPALAALLALASLPVDGGANLLVVYGQDNPYAGAMIELNDPAPTSPQIFANLAVLGEVGTAALADSRLGTNTAAALVFAKAVAAIDTVSAFAAGDGANTGATTDLTGTSRVRLATDLFAVLSLSTIQSQFGINITAYKSATGSATLSGADLTGLLANRISANPTGSSVQELKEWMALLSYVGTGLKGTIGTAYGSTPDFTQFAGFGAAVATRNAAYPLAAVGQLAGTMAGLHGAPVCSAVKPSVAAVTSGSYAANVPAAGTMIVWGSGFSASGGNSLRLTRSGSGESVTLNAGGGSYFWDLSPYQINAALPAGTAAGQWTLTAQNACGNASAGVAVTLQ